MTAAAIGIRGVTAPARASAAGAAACSNTPARATGCGVIVRTPQGRPVRPTHGVSGEFESEARGLCDLARADAPGAHPDVLRSAVDHCTHPLEVWQPAPFRYIVSVGDVAAAHRTLAADFTSLRHFRTPSRDPRMGVEFNTTGWSDYQVLDEDCASFFQPYRLRNMRGAAKRTVKYFTERRAGSNLIPLFERKNDTLIRRYGPSSELKKRWYRGLGGILKKFKQLKKIKQRSVSEVDASIGVCDPCS